MTLPHLDFYTDSLPENVGGDAHAFVNRYLTKYRADVGIHKHEQTHNAQWYAWLAMGALLAGVFYSMPQFLQPYWPFPLMFGAGMHSLLYGNLTFFGIHYPGVASYRQWAEVQAYQVQLANNPPDWPDYTERYAGYISTNYNLTITPEAALKLLKN